MDLRKLRPRASFAPLPATLLAVVAVGALGCATPRYDAHGNLYYEHYSHRRAAGGAVLGGLAGAGIGAAVADPHHDEAGFWIGGALGALTGAAIGDAIDREEAARRRAHRHDHRYDRRRDPRHRGPDRRHRRGPYRHHDDDWDDRWDDDWYHGSDARDRADPDPDPLVLSVPGEVIFEPGSVALSPGAKRRLREVAQALRRHPEAVAVVRGHTDDTRREKRRPDLSEARAEAVRAHLLHHGVAPSRVTALGMGPRFPVARNDTAEGRQRNRRVEIEIRAGRGHDLAGLW